MHILILAYSFVLRVSMSFFDVQTVEIITVADGTIKLAALFEENDDVILTAFYFVFYKSIARVIPLRLDVVLFVYGLTGLHAR